MPQKKRLAVWNIVNFDDGLQMEERERSMHLHRKRLEQVAYSKSRLSKEIENPAMDKYREKFQKNYRIMVDKQKQAHQEKIDKENRFIVRRIMKTKPVIQKKVFDDHWNKHEKYIKNHEIARQKRKKQRSLHSSSHSQSISSLTTSRSMSTITNQSQLNIYAQNKMNRKQYQQQNKQNQHNLKSLSARTGQSQISRHSSISRIQTNTNSNNNIKNDENDDDSDRTTLDDLMGSINYFTMGYADIDEKKKQNTQNMNNIQNIQNTNNVMNNFIVNQNEVNNNMNNMNNMNIVNNDILQSNHNQSISYLDSNPNPNMSNIYDNSTNHNINMQSFSQEFSDTIPPITQNNNIQTSNNFLNMQHNVNVGVKNSLETIDEIGNHKNIIDNTSSSNKFQKLHPSQQFQTIPQENDYQSMSQISDPYSLSSFIDPSYNTNGITISNQFQSQHKLQSLNTKLQSQSQQSIQEWELHINKPNKNQYDSQIQHQQSQSSTNNTNTNTHHTKSEANPYTLTILASESLAPSNYNVNDNNMNINMNIRDKLNDNINITDEMITKKQLSEHEKIIGIQRQVSLESSNNQFSETLCNIHAEIDRLAETLPLPSTLGSVMTDEPKNNNKKKNNKKKIINHNLVYSPLCNNIKNNRKHKNIKNNNNIRSPLSLSSSHHILNTNKNNRYESEEISSDWEIDEEWKRKERDNQYKRKKSRAHKVIKIGFPQFNF